MHERMRVNLVLCHPPPSRTAKRQRANLVLLSPGAVAALIGSTPAGARKMHEVNLVPAILPRQERRSVSEPILPSLKRSFSAFRDS